jgi:hypothetical protein
MKAAIWKPTACRCGRPRHFTVSVVYLDGVATWRCDSCGRLRGPVRP